MQATNVSAIASAVSAAIGAASAVVAAISAWNSRKSARASLVALEETRRQREIDNARSELAAIGMVYDNAMAFAEALAAEYRRDPGAVEQRREVLLRSMMVAGLSTPVLQELAEAREPVTQSAIAALRRELTDQSALRHSIMTRSVLVSDGQ